MKSGCIVLGLIAGIFSTSTLASSVFLRHSFDFGGETLARLEYRGGASDSLRAGDGEHTEIGYEFQTPFLDSENLSTELSFGYKYDLLYADNIDVEFDRWTATLVQYYKKSNPRIGLGISRHFRGKYKYSGAQISTWESKINIAHGAVFLVDYHFRSPWNIGAKLSRMKYTDRGARLDANSVGVFLGYSF